MGSNVTSKHERWPRLINLAHPVESTRCPLTKFERRLVTPSQGWQRMQLAGDTRKKFLYLDTRLSPSSKSATVNQILSKSDDFSLTISRFSKRRISAILNFRGPIMGSLKSPCRTSYWSSIETIAPNFLVFEKIAFLGICILATDERTDRQTDGCDVPWRDVMAADLCWTLFVADCYCGASEGELLAYLLWCIRLFGLEFWSIWDSVCSRMSVKIRSYVLFVVLTLVYSGLEFSRCQRCI